MDAYVNSLTEEQRQELMNSLHARALPRKSVMIPAPVPLSVGRTLEDLQEWLEDMAKHILSQGFDGNDPNLIYIYEQNFSPDLQIQWRTFRRASRVAEEEVDITIDTLTQWLQRFCLPSPRLEDHVRALIRTTQGPAGVAEYLPRFHEAITRIPALTPELVVAFFLAGLRETISQELRNETLADLQGATAAALMVERRLGQERPKIPAARQEFPKEPHSRGERLRCSICQRFGHEAANCYVRQGRTSRGQAPSPPGPPFASSSSSSSPSSSSSVRPLPPSTSTPASVPRSSTPARRPLN